MTINAARTAGQAVRTGGEREILRSLIDWQALRRLGWDPGRQLFAPACGDPVFGFAECRTVSCDQVSATSRFGLCDRCLGRWRQSPAGTTVEEFCHSEPARPAKLTHALCLVCRTPGHERPVHYHERPVHYQGLCGACASSMGQRGQSVTEYINGDYQYGPAAPRASFGRCEAAACQPSWAARFVCLSLREMDR